MIYFLQSLSCLQMMYQQYLRAAAEPIDLPHRMNFFILNRYFKMSMTAATSYFQLAPNEIQSPYELPQPLKSKLQKEMPIFKILSMQVVPIYDISTFQPRAIHAMEIDYTCIGMNWQRTVVETGIYFLFFMVLASKIISFTILMGN